MPLEGVVGIAGLAVSFLRVQRAEGKSPLTVKLYAVRIARLVRFVEAETTSDDISGLIRRRMTDFYATRAASVAPSPVSIDFRVHRVFLRWCVEEGKMTASPPLAGGSRERGRPAGAAVDLEQHPRLGIRSRWLLNHLTPERTMSSIPRRPSGASRSPTRDPPGIGSASPASGSATGQEGSTVAVDATVLRSRRALLGAAFGALAASAAQALGHPAGVRAGSDGDVVLGGENTSASTTKLWNLADNWFPVLWAQNTKGSGLQGSTSLGDGVVGWTIDTDGSGVVGSADAGRGVSGEARAGTGVRGTSNLHGCGVYGRSGIDELDKYPAQPANTGVFGYSAIDTTAVGVRGESPAGSGVEAVSATGNALRVTGKARFSRAGKASVAAGKAYVDVTVPGGLASTSIVNATIQRYRSGVGVAGVRLNYPSAGKIRIHLTKVASASSSTPVAWFVVEYGG